MPKNIFVTYHAAKRYLERILGLKPPISSRKVATARLFLTKELGNRVLDIYCCRHDQAVYRIELTYKGMLIVYEPETKQVITITSDGRNKEKLKMELAVPINFRLTGEIRNFFKKESWRKFYICRWPVIGRRAWALILDVNGHRIEVNYAEKTVYMEPGTTRRFPFALNKNGMGNKKDYLREKGVW